MSNQENSNSFKLNIGGPSIILLLTVLGLAVFSILAVRAAYSGLGMARTSQSAVAAYYEAEGIVQTTEFRIREALAASDVDSIAGIDHVISVEPGIIVYEVPVNDRSVIHVELKGSDDYSQLKIADHRLVVESAGEYSGSAFEVNLIDIN